jgi:acyl-homoserine-lactone acylase
MIRLVSSTAVALLATIVACTSDAPHPGYQAELRTTTYGVPHVRADDFASLGWGVAQAYLRQNFCLLADQIVTARGERSKFHGPDANAILAFVPVPNRDADFFYRSYFDDTVLAAAYRETSAEVHALVRGFVAGYNEFLDRARAQPSGPACLPEPWVRPITERDYLRLLADKAVLASGAAFARAIATAQPPEASSAAAEPVTTSALDADVVRAQLHPVPERGAASNAYAIGRAATANDAGMLLGNPHWPWFGNNRFFQIHMTVPGRYDVFGVMNGDAPLPLIGFNDDVAWTHTVSPALRHTVYALRLASGAPTRYVVDGAEREMTARPIEIEVRRPDGSLGTERRTLYDTHLGPVMQVDGLVPGGVNLRWTASTAYTLRDANRASMRLLEQWLRIGQAKSVGDIERALRDVAAIPYVHTVATDRHGDAFHADIGATPNVRRAQLRPSTEGGCVDGTTAAAVLALVNIPILDGSRSACDWEVAPDAPRPGLMPAAQLPATRRSDYVANSNQSAWFVHPQARIDDLEPILGTAGTPLTLRQRLAFTQIEQRLAASDGLAATPRFDSLETMREMLFGNRVLAAELSLDGKAATPLTHDLLALCRPAPGQNVRLVTVLGSATPVDVAPACQVLAAWDGRSRVDSRGAVLFREFWRRLRMPAGTPLWLTPFDPADPVHTPRALNTQPGIAADTVLLALAQTVADLQAKGIDITRPLGDLQAVTRAGQRIPLSGGDEFEGAFNKLTMRENNVTVPLGPAGYTEVTVGSSYVQAVTWIDGRVRAQGLLAYSQAGDPASPHHADQTRELFAAQRFVTLPFSADEVAAAQVGAVDVLVSAARR